jgi:MFS family permease
MIAYMVSFIDRTIMALLIDPIRRDLGLTDTEISLLVGFAFALFYTVLGIPFGRWVDVRERRWLVVTGIAFWSVMTAACGLARNFWEMFLARMGVGVGEATLSPASYSLIADYFPKERLGLAMSIYASGVTIGGGLALMVGGFVAQWAARVGAVDLPLLGEVRGWQVAFMAVGLPGLLVALLAVCIREPARRSAGAAGTAPAAPAPSLSETARYIGRNGRAFGGVFIGYGLVAIMSYAVVIWVPTFYMRVHAMAPGEVGLIYGLMFMICGTAGMLTGGAISDRLAARGALDAPARVFLGSTLLQAPFLVGAVLVPDTALSLSLMGVGLFVLTATGGLQGATVQIMSPNRMRGQTAALYLLTANLIGLGIGPTLTAVLSDTVFGGPMGIGRAIAATAAIALPLAAVLIALSLGPVRAVAGALRQGDPA